MMDNCKAKCSRPPKLLKSNVYQPVSNTLAGQTLIYMQMSNHYRRVENAKSIVDSGLNNTARTRHCNYYDTNTNKTFNGANSSDCNSTRHSNLHSASSTRTNLNDNCLYSPSPSDMDLVDQIIYDDKHKPNAFYKDANGMVFAPTSHIQCVKARDPKKKKTSSKTRAKSRSRSPAKSVKKNLKKPSVPTDIIDHHPKQFVPSKSFQPRILKSTAQSRVQELSVYHAPRRKRQPSQEGAPEDNLWLTNSQIQLLDQVNKGAPHNVHYSDPWNFDETEIKHSEADKRPSSKGSSRSYGCDSAYCGGVSSGGGSRGSTPERSLSAKKTPPLKQELPFNEETYSSADSQDFPLSERATNRDAEFVGGSFTAKGNIETLYATFLRNITEDILERGIFTDKGINSIFQRHIEDNKYDLDQERMRLEVSSLRKQLGIVEDVATYQFTSTKPKTPNLGTDLNASAGEIHCRDDCFAGCKAQPLQKTQNVNPKQPGIEDIIRDMEHCVKVDAHSVESKCCCPNEKKSHKLGCGCDNTCTNTFEQFFEMDRTGVGNSIGNRTYTTEQVNNISYCMAEPYEGKYQDESNSVKTYDETNQIDEGTSDESQDERMFDYDEMEDINISVSKSFTKSSHALRGQTNSAIIETTNISKESFSNDVEVFISDTDMEGNDSCGSAHVDSLCAQIKVESNDDFMIEKYFVDNIRHSFSQVDQAMNETELLSKNNFSDMRNENARGQMKEFPDDPLDSSSVMDSSGESELSSQNGGLLHDDTADGRTVYFNKAKEEESSTDTARRSTDSRHKPVDKTMKRTGAPIKENLVNVPTTSSKALVTFASDGSTPANSTNLPGNSEASENVGADQQTSLEPRRRDGQPSEGKKGCFPCSKKKAVQTTAPPLKSALKARE